MRKIIVTDVSNVHLPKYYLSLFGLLFRTNKFVLKDSLKREIFHPFQYTLVLRHYRQSCSVEDLEKHILKFCEPLDFYLDEHEKGLTYVHFFSAVIGEKVYKANLDKTSQFTESYQIKYASNNYTLNELYSYKTNIDYYNYLQEYENVSVKALSITFTEGKKKEIKPDEDGFITVKKKK